MISLYNCMHIWTQEKSVFLKNELFINGPGNRRVILYTVDALLVPGVFILYEHLFVPQCVICSTKWFFKVFCLHALKVSTGKC